MSEEPKRYIALANQDATHWGRSGYSLDDLNGLFRKVNELSDKLAVLTDKVEEPERLRQVLALLDKPRTWSFIQRRVKIKSDDRWSWIKHGIIKSERHGTQHVYSVVKEEKP